MLPVMIIAFLVLGIMLAAAALWYLRARTALANNPRLIRAGAGAVKGGLFLRLARRYRSESRLDEREAAVRAAAVVQALYGDIPEDPNVVVFLQDNVDAVSEGLTSLARETPQVRSLITDALRFRTRLPSSGEQDSLSEAVRRASDLGILVSGRERVALWGFVKEAARFLTEENRQGREQAPGQDGDGGAAGGAG